MGWGDETRTLTQDISTSRELRKEDLKQMQEDTRNFLIQTGSELKDMSTRLKADLAREETDRVKQAQIMIRERVTAVDELLGEVKAERGKAAAAWLELANVMQAEPAKKEAMAKAEPVEMATPETTALNDQVFAYLADHPDGTRMTELEEEFGVARIKMARLLKELMDENKAEKRDMLYFAI